MFFCVSIIWCVVALSSFSVLDMVFCLLGRNVLKWAWYFAKLISSSNFIINHLPTNNLSSLMYPINNFGAWCAWTCFMANCLCCNFPKCVFFPLPLLLSHRWIYIVVANKKHATNFWFFNFFSSSFFEIRNRSIFMHAILLIVRLLLDEWAANELLNYLYYYEYYGWRCFFVSLLKNWPFCCMSCIAKEAFPST